MRLWYPIACDLLFVTKMNFTVSTTAESLTGPGGHVEGRGPSQAIRSQLFSTGNNFSGLPRTSFQIEFSLKSSWVFRQSKISKGKKCIEDIHHYSLIVLMVMVTQSNSPQLRLCDRLLCPWCLQSVRSKNCLYVQNRINTLRYSNSFSQSHIWKHCRHPSLSRVLSGPECPPHKVRSLKQCYWHHLASN